MAQTIQFRRGNEVNLPSLAPGEPAVTLDTGNIFVGSPSGNIGVVKKGELVVNVKDFGAVGGNAAKDTAAFQQALDKAITNGSVNIIVPPGSYWLNNRLYIYKNTKITFEKGAKLVRKSTYGYFVNGKSGDNFTGYSGNGNIIIDGGEFEGNLGEYMNTYNAFGLARGENMIFRNMVIKDVRGAHAFDVNACKNVLFENIKFLGYNTDYTTVGDNVSYYREAIQISDHIEAGFSLFGAFDGTPCEDITVRNCYFGASGSPNTVPYPTGVGNHGSVHNSYNSNIKIINNIFDGCSYAGFRAFKYKDVLVDGNSFINCGNGVAISSVAPNTESSKDANGVQSGLPQAGSNYTIVNNIFRNCINQGIYGAGQMDTAIANPARVDGLLISNNIFDGSPNSIDLALTKDTIISNNKLMNTTAGSSILLAYPEDIIISNNHAKDLGSELVFMDEPDVSWRGKDFTKGVFVSGNVIRRANRTGIFIQYANNFHVVDNFIDSVARETDNTRNGILIAGGAKNGLVSRNKVVKALTGNQNKYGIEVTATCSNVRTYDNDADGKTGKQLNAGIGGSFEGAYIHSPNGTRYKMTVSDAGAVVLTVG